MNLKITNIHQKFTVLLVIASLLLSLSGCFDRRELDTLGITLGVAIDKADKPGEIELTVQLANPSGGSSGSSGKSSKGSSGESSGASMKYINVSATGKNINYIVREMQHKMSRRIYVAHSEVIVLGEDLAKEGVRDCLDFFARAPEARMTLNIFVAKGKAKDVLSKTPEFEKMPSVELAKILKDQKITSHAPIVTEFEFVQSMISGQTDAVAPIVTILEENGLKRLNVDGCAVFRDGIMVGEFNSDQTRGLLLIQNKVKTGVMQLNIEDITATVEYRRSKSKVTPVLYSDGTSLFKIEVNVTVGLGDQSGTFNLSDPDNTTVMISAAESAVKQEIQSAIDKSKEFDTDVFGFGDLLNKRYPEQWSKMEEQWDELYKDVSVSITVKVQANGNGRINKPLAPEKM